MVDAEGLGVDTGPEEGVDPTREVDVGLVPGVGDEVPKWPVPGAWPECSAHPESRLTVTAKAATAPAMRPNRAVVARHTKRPPMWLRSSD